MAKRIVMVFVSLALSAVTWASQPAAPQGGFVPVKDLPPADQLPAAPLLITAYSLVWLFLMIYLWSIWRRLGRVERELSVLKRSGSGHSRSA